MDLLLGYCWQNYLESQCQPHHALHQPLILRTAAAAQGLCEPEKPCIRGLNAALDANSPALQLVYSSLGVEHFMPLAPPPSALPILFPLHGNSIVKSEQNTTSAQFEPPDCQSRANPIPLLAERNAERGFQKDDIPKSTSSCASVDSGFESGGASPTASDDSNPPAPTNRRGELPMSFLLCDDEAKRPKPEPQQPAVDWASKKKILLLRSVDAGGRVYVVLIHPIKS